jgi:flagellar biogenesis protein FliO
MSMELVQQGLSLVAVFALLGAALWFVKTRQNPLSRKLGGDRRMQVLERVALTPQHTICLVRVGQRLVMIGTAPSSCQLLQTIEDPLQ